MNRQPNRGQSLLSWATWEGAINANQPITIGLAGPGYSAAFAVSSLGTIAGETNLNNRFSGLDWEIRGLLGDVELVLKTGTCPSPVPVGSIIGAHSGPVWFDSFKLVLRPSLACQNAVLLLGTGECCLDLADIRFQLTEQYQEGSNMPSLDVSDEYRRRLRGWVPLSQANQIGLNLVGVGPHVVVAPPVATSRLVFTLLDYSIGSISTSQVQFLTNPGAVRVHNGYTYVSKPTTFVGPHVLILPKGQGLNVTFSVAASYGVNAQYVVVPEGTP